MASNVFPIEYFTVGIFSAPNEILDEIVSHLDPTDQSAVMSTCVLLHAVTSRRLYRHIDVESGIQGDRLFQTLIHSKAGYATHTRTLHYGSEKTYYTHTFHKLLMKALQCLTRLVHLSLQVRPTAFFAAFAIKKAIGSEIPVDMCSLSGSLVSFQLCGDIRLLDIGASDTITKITVTNKFNQLDIESLLDVIAPSGQNSVLTELNLTLARSENGCDIISTMHQVSHRCPNIEVLALRAPLVNALETTRILTLEPVILPKLRRLSINTVTILTPYFEGGTQATLLKQQQNDLMVASTLRPGLVDVGFGVIQWTRIENPDTNTWRMSTRRVTNVDVEESRRFPKGAGVSHFFWNIHYSVSQ